MDSKHFRKNTDPNVYGIYKNAKINKAQYQLPIDVVPDNRYSEWPALMSDARYTDYSTRCSKNVPVDKQFPTKQWLIHSADEILIYNRQHALPTTRSLDISVLPPPAQVLSCTKYDCKIKNTNETYGIGLERSSSTPYLFGTFDEQKYETKPQNSHTTQYYEGGRNTPRGINNSYSE